MQSPRYALFYKFACFAKSQPATRDLLLALDSIPSERVCDLVAVVPSIQHSFSGIVVHHGVVSILVCKLYFWVPICSCLGVISIVDGSGILIVSIDKVNHSTGHKGIANRHHLFCLKQRNKQNKQRKPHIPWSHTTCCVMSLYAVQSTLMPW